MKTHICVFRAALLAACCVLGTACAESRLEPSPAPSQEAALAGADGDATINVPDTIVNRYAVLAAEASAGATSIDVTAASDLNDPALGPLEAGDLVFIIQMQGASIDTSDSPAYGTVTNLNGAGFHEFAVVQRVQGNTLFLGCSALRNSYTLAGRTQVVRVPQFSNLRIEDEGTLVARPWDGQRGGVVVVHVAGTTTLSGTIDVTGQGFRPGVRDNNSAPAGTQVTLYRSNDDTQGAEKGESIAGHGADYAALGGRFGRGAPANGGGGGNSYNAGGGGGANGNSGRVWRGQGVMTSTVAGASAWALDPGYAANGNARTDDSGGGRGGYSASFVNADALTVGPNNAAWGGNNRAEAGGLGGHPLDNDATSRLFLGGGGGAGDGNDNASSNGGGGGGLVYLISTAVNGSGPILANGASAPNTTGAHNDAAGGGGGGGTVIVLSNNLSGISVYANGGLGGRQLISSSEAEGPGGGGGGGFIALSGGTVDAFAVGGDSGSTNSTSLTEFPVNGATFGGLGQVVAAPSVLPPALACVPVDLAITLTNPETTFRPGTTAHYTVTVTNAGPFAATNAPVSVPLPANASGATWTCSAAGGAACQTPSGTGGIATTVTVPPGGTVTFTFDADVSPSAVDTFTVTATVSAPNPSSDTDPTNNTATDTNTNPPPTAVDDEATAVEDSQDNPIDVLANDSAVPDTGEPLTIVEVTQGNHGGTVTITEGGTRVVYTPAPGFFGTETFTYTISSGNRTATATVTVTVVEKIVRRVVGRGCSASGDGLPNAFWVLVALAGLAWMGRRDARARSRGLGTLVGLGAVAVLAASPSAQAQSSSTAIDVQQFKPAPGRSGVLGLHGAGFPGHLSWNTGLYIHYAHEPLVVINERNEDLLQHLVKNQWGFDLVGAMGFGDHFELGALIPISLQHGEFNEQVSGATEQTWEGGLGDLRLIPKAEIYENERLRLAAVAPLVFPTGGKTSLRGQKGVGAQPRVAADYTLEGGTRLVANVGVNLRTRQELLNLSVGTELAYGFGAAIPFQLQGHQLTGMASLAGALGLGATGGANEEEIPLELQAGLQYHFNKNVVGTLGLGRGMTLGYGMPSFRVLTGVAWITEDAPRGRARDADGDGLDNADDKCPEEAEDEDGFQDEDGCPDPDNDQDGILDDKDKCPLQPEDKDGFQDEDGCPDPDNDRDGIYDADDQCPAEQETINGVDDEDGCPDEGTSQVELTGGSIVIRQKVYFDTNKDVVLERSFPLLKQVGLLLRANPQITKVRVEGHTDSRADDAFNMDLSQRRAGNVRKYLVQEAGIDPARLESVGYGESQPVDTNDTDQGRENNRRVVFTILELDGKPVTPQ
jgi:uncharacterized repeat protein (TIGR01451 family)